MNRITGLPRYVLGTITSVSTEAKAAALTFDDGPDPETTPRVLETLERHGARATFFMVGDSASRYPRLVRQVAAAGHAVGNHSWDHSSFPLLSGRERRRQVQRTRRVLEPYGLPLFRPPFGEQSIKSRLDAMLLRYNVVAWNLELGDWWNHDSDSMARKLVSKVRKGSIVLLHDALRLCPDSQRRPSVGRSPLFDRKPMLEALEKALEEIGGGMRFVSLPELLSLGVPRRRNWYRATPPPLDGASFAPGRMS